MESVLKELYFKGCGIKSDSKKAYNEELELVRLLDKNQQKLNVLLKDEGKLRLEKLSTCYDELSLLTESKAFVSGFRLGGRIIMEIFFGDKGFDFTEWLIFITYQFYRHLFHKKYA